MPTPPIPPEGESYYATARATIAQWIAQADTLRALGLPEDAVFSADTAESPLMRPFVVLRWLDREDAMGGAWVQPVMAWVYDDFGDFERASAIAKEIGRLLSKELVQARTATGWVNQVIDRGVGADLADDGFDALVIPQNLAVVGRGD